MRPIRMAVCATVAAFTVAGCSGGEPVDYLANSRPVVERALQGFGVSNGPMDMQMSGSRTLMVQLARMKKSDGDVFADGVCREIANAMSANRNRYPDLIQIYDMSSEYWTQCQP